MLFRIQEKKARLKDGEIKQRGVQEEVRRFAIAYRRTRARENSEYESESSRNLWRARSLKIIERHKSPGVGTTSSLVRNSSLLAPRGAQTQCSRLLKRRQNGGEKPAHTRRGKKRKKEKKAYSGSNTRIRYRNSEFTARNSRCDYT